MSRTADESVDLIRWKLERLETGSSRPALIWRDRETSCEELAARCGAWRRRFRATGVRPGDCVALVADYSPASISCLLALFAIGAVAAPFHPQAADRLSVLLGLARADWSIVVDDRDDAGIERGPSGPVSASLEILRRLGDPGLILFTSGSTGAPRGIVHAIPRLLEGLRRPRPSYRAIALLLFDHIGGLNTLFVSLANFGCLIVPADRGVATVCRAIERHRADLLPATPSFLRLMLLAEAHRTWNLSALRLITYGAEVMPEATLRQVAAAFPQAKLRQTYGLSELGILRARARSATSLFVQLGGEQYETKVVDGTLRIRAKCAMVGYLDAASPFDDDGWFDTGDLVEQDGTHLRILGRRADVINVGGLKAHPTEIERVIGELPEILEVTVTGEPSPWLGQVVAADVRTAAPMAPGAAKRLIVRHCRRRLPAFMIPVRVRVLPPPTGEVPLGARLKRARERAPAARGSDTGRS